MQFYQDHRIGHNNTFENNLKYEIAFLKFANMKKLWLYKYIVINSLAIAAQVQLQLLLQNPHFYL